MSSADGSAARAKVGRARWRRILVWLSLILVVGLAAVSGFVRLRIEDWTRDWIVSRLAREGLHAEIGDVRIRVSRLQAEARDCEVLLPPGVDGTLRLHVPYLRVGIGLSTLVGIGRSRVDLAELYLDRPTLETDDRFLESWPPPSDRDPGRPIDLRIGRLRMFGGLWSHADRSVPMELEAERLRVIGARDGRDGPTIGEISGRLHVTREPLGRPLLIDWSSGFRWSGQQIDLSGIRAEGGGLLVDLNGRIDWSNGGSVAGSGMLRADLDRFDQWLARDFPRIGGGLQGPVRIEHRDGALTIDLDARATRPVFETIAAADASATVRYEPGRVTIADLRATAYDGALEGRIDVELGSPERFAVSLKGERLSARKLLEWIQLPLPFASRVNASIDLAGEPARRASWVGGATFVALRNEGPAGRGSMLPVSGTGRIGFSDGRIDVRVPDFRGGAANLAVEAAARLDGDARGYVELRGTTRDATVTQEATLRILRRLGVDPPELLERPLAGSGRVKARIAFGGEADVKVALDLDDGRVSGQDFDRLGLDCTIAGDLLQVERLALASAAGRVAGTAALALEPFELRSLELDAEEISLAALLPLFVTELEVEGKISAKIAARTTGGELSGEGVIGLSELQWEGESLDEIVGELQIEGDRYRLLNVAAKGAAVEARGEAVWQQDDGLLGFTIEDLRLVPSELRSLTASVDGAITGSLNLSGTGQISADGPSGEFRVQWEKLAIQGLSAGPGFGLLRLGAKSMTASIQSADERWWTLDGTLAWEPELPVQAVLHLAGAEFDPAPGHDPPLRAQLTGRFVIDGPLSRPEDLVVGGELNDGSLSIGARHLRLLEPTSVTVADGDVAVGPLKIAGPVSDVEISLHYTIDGGRLTSEARGTLDLALLNLLVPEIRAQGEVEIALESDGTLEEPGISGAASIVRGRVRYLGFPHTVEAIDVIFEIDAGRAAFDDLRAVIGGGELLGIGEVTVGRGGIEGLDLTVEAIGVRVALPEGFAAIYDGLLQLQGPLEELVLGGRLELVQGVYDEPFDLGGVLGYRTRQYTTVESGGLAEQVTLNVDLFAPGNVWVRNDLAQLETRFDLHLGGTPSLPEVGGRLEVLEGGKLRFRNVEYTVDAASLDFAESDRLNPYLTLDARTTVREYEVFLHVEGALDRFEYQLTSSPTLSTQDIITLLATGTTLEELRDSGRTGALTGDVAAVYFAGTLGGRYEKQLGRSLGLDRLQIHPSLAEGGDATTRITVGKQVSDHVGVIVSTEVGSTEDELYQIEWQASPRSRMTVQRDTNGGVGSDIFYTKRFWWRKREDDAAPDESPAQRPRGARPAGPAESTVREVRIEGVDQQRARELRRLVPIEAGEGLRRSAQFEGRQAIRRRYVKEGRIEVDVLSEIEELAPGNVDLVYRIDPGPAIDVRIEGVDKDKDRKRIRQQLEDLWTEALYEQDLEHDSVELIRDYFQAQGYYAVDVYAEHAGGSDGPVLTFRIDRGHQVEVSQVRFRGVEAIDEPRLRRQLLTRTSGVFGNPRFDPQVLREDLVALRNLYRDEGFLQVEIPDPEIRLSLDAKSMEIVIPVVEGDRFRIGELTLRGGEPFSPEELREWLGLASGDPFSPAKLLVAVTNLRRALDERGHPDARVVPGTTVANSTVRLEVAIDAGSEIRVGEIRISGNYRTREALIRNQLQFAAGEPLSREKIRRSQHALYRLGVFRNVGIDYRPAPGENGSERIVEVRLAESKPLSMALGIGYNTESKLNLSFKSAKQNIGGRLASLALQGRWNEDLRRLQLISRRPRTFGRDLPLLTNLLWEEDDQTDGFTVERWSTAVRLERALGRRWKAFLRYGYQIVDVFDIEDPLAVQDEKLEDARLGDVGLTFGRNSLDDELLPTRGNRFVGRLQWFADPFLSEFDFLKLSINESHRWTFRNTTSFVTAARFAVIDPYGSTSDVPISERFFAGGSSTVRGFDTDRLGPLENDLPVGGEAMLILNQEFQVPIWRALKGVVFYDSGNVFRRSRDFDLGDMRHVVGTGIRYETPIGPLRAEYGWKLDREPGESRGQFFFSIGNAF